MAGLIGYGLRASAFAWSQGKLVPVFIYLDGQKFLGLVPESLVHTITKTKFVLAGGAKYPFSSMRYRYALVAKHKNNEKMINTLCYFPPNIKLESNKKLWKR